MKYRKQKCIKRPLSRYTLLLSGIDFVLLNMSRTTPREKTVNETSTMKEEDAIEACRRLAIEQW